MFLGAFLGGRDPEALGPEEKAPFCHDDLSGLQPAQNGVEFADRRADPHGALDELALLVFGRHNARGDVNVPGWGASETQWDINGFGPYTGLAWRVGIMRAARVFKVSERELEWPR